jgi:hypothetical protein
MFHTPAHKQVDAAKAPAQIVNVSSTRTYVLNPDPAR